MKTKKKNARWRLIAHTKIQVGLLFRLLMYWCAFQFVQAATVLLFHFISNGEVTLFRNLVTSTIASLVILPVLMLDLIEFSNRFVGPVRNLGDRIKELGGGGPARELKLRSGDFYQDLVEPFNQIRCSVVGIRGNGAAAGEFEEMFPEVAKSNELSSELPSEAGVEAAPSFPSVSIVSPVSSGEQHA